MLYNDSDIRNKAIMGIAYIFDQQGYKKTASNILEYCKILDGTQVPSVSEFTTKLNSTFDILEKDFSDTLLSKDYGIRCFRDNSTIISNAIRKSGSSFKQSLLIATPLLKRMADTREITSLIARELPIIKNKETILHLFCYTYLIIVEGLFDELSRLLYFMKLLSEGKSIALPDLEDMNIWRIYDEFKPEPVFFENFREKKHIRNAIAHASVKYNDNKREVEFIDEDWNETISVDEFVKKGEELETSVMTFMYIFNVLRINDLIMSPNPFA